MDEPDLMIYHAFSVNTTLVYNVNHYGLSHLGKAKLIISFASTDNFEDARCVHFRQKIGMRAFFSKNRKRATADETTAKISYQSILTS